MQENYKLTAENVVKGFSAEELRALIGKRNEDFEEDAKKTCNDKKLLAIIITAIMMKMMMMMITRYPRPSGMPLHSFKKFSHI